MPNPTCENLPHRCKHCGIPFESVAQLVAHGERAGHDVGDVPLCSALHPVSGIACGEAVGHQPPHLGCAWPRVAWVSSDMARCPCGTLLVSAVSRAAHACNGCRWEDRAELGPYGLRLLARGYGEKAVRMRAAGELVEAMDHESEANALLSAAAEREADHG